MKKGMVLACALALVLGVMIGCAGDDDDGGGAVINSARGHYTDPDIAGGLPAASTITITDSNFPTDCGPQEGDADIVSVDVLTETLITISAIDGDAGVDTETFVGSRSPAGAADSVVGTWRGFINVDEPWTIILEADLDIIVRTPWATCH
ncbi:MAG: hypothetical protein A2V67_10290 [Deltaproteobacteria bacterium RBG_13_61_14]|nr:MAG: hypothetical protein A2V67_10290 [Deltaproteobacteria bacterium RBG_13_61_14]